MTGFAQQLAERIAQIDPHALAPAEIRWATSAAIDTVAVAIAGSMTETARIARLVEQPTGGEAIVLGISQHASPPTAAFLNGIAAHALEYDDYSHDVRGHPSALLYSTLLATPGIGMRSGPELIAAYIAGLKVQAFLAKRMGMGHAGRGWHVTTTIGAIAAAAASATLMRLDPARTATALSLATSLASGHRANFGTMAKSLQLGHASRNGLTATLLAANGMSANAHAFDGNQGFFRAYADGVEAAAPDSDWASTPIDFENSGFRLNPGCGALLGAAQAAIALHAKGIGIDEIETIEIVAEQEKFSQTDRPCAPTPEAAHFSIQHAVARGLVSGRLAAADYTAESVTDPEVISLMRRIRLVPNPDATRTMGFGAIVRLTLGNGTTHQRSETGIAGMGDIDMVGNAAHRTKFNTCIGPLLNPERVDRLWDTIARIATLERLAPLLDQASV